jgi:hypothetical protein
VYKTNKRRLFISIFKISSVCKTKSAEFVDFADFADFAKSAEFVDIADFVGKKLQTFAIPSNYANVQARQ